MDNTITYNLKLLKVNCYMSDESDADEVFLKKDGKKIWPEKKFLKMKENSENLNLEFKLEKGSKTLIEIWDYDFLTRNDKLGEITILADKMGGPYTTDFNKTEKGNGRYSLEWEIF